MKITKLQLKQIIKEELDIMTEQPSEEDLGTARDLEADADLRASMPPTPLTAGRIQIDLLTDIRGLLQQILNKP